MHIASIDAQVVVVSSSQDWSTKQMHSAQAMASVPSQSTCPAPATPTVKQSPAVIPDTSASGKVVAPASMSAVILRVITPSIKHFASAEACGP